jgi:hypothetical protein
VDDLFKLAIKTWGHRPRLSPCVAAVENRVLDTRIILSPNTEAQRRRHIVHKLFPSVRGWAGGRPEAMMSPADLCSGYQKST